MNVDSVRNAIEDRHQFNIIHPSSGLKVDVIISKRDDFDQSRFERIKRLNVSENESANFAAPEDVIIKKLEYFKKGGSEKHLLPDFRHPIDISFYLFHSLLEHTAYQIFLLEKCTLFFAGDGKTG
jgi:hypothetical protein